MGDFGIKTSTPGNNVFTSSGSSINFNSDDPFIKLDTQNDKSFQTIDLLITTDPPEPVFPVTNTYTTVYQFAHGYDYVPSLEVLFFVATPPPGTAFYQEYFQDSGQIAAQTIFDGAVLYAIADATNVYFIVWKFNTFGLGSPNLLTGTNVQITCHVFVEDIGQ